MAEYKDVPMGLFDDGDTTPMKEVPMNLFDQEPKQKAIDKDDGYTQRLQSGVPMGSEDHKRNRQRLKEIGKSMYLGFLESAGGITQKAMNLGVLPQVGLPVLEREIKQQRSDYDKMPAGQGLGAARMAGNVAGLLPLGGPMRALGRLPQLAGSVLGRIGALPVAGAAQGALAGGSQYDYSNPNSQFNVPQGAMGAVGGAVLGVGGNALRALRSAKHPQQMAGDVYNKIVSKISKKIMPDDNMATMEKAASRYITTVAKKLKGKEKVVWRDQLLDKIGDKPADSVALNSVRSRMQSYVKEYGDELPVGHIKSVQRLLDKSEKGLTVNAAKELRSNFRVKVKDPVWKLQNKAEASYDTAEAANGIYDDLTNLLRSSSDKYGLGKQFTIANSVSRNINKFSEQTGADLGQLATDRAVAAKFIKNFFPAKSAEGTLAAAGKAGDTMGNMMQAKYLRELGMKSMRGNMFDVNSFVNNLSKDPNAQAIMQNNPQAKMLQSFVDIAQRWAEPGGLKIAGAPIDKGALVKIASPVLNYLSKPSSTPLKKALLNAGLATRNEKMKQYFQNKAVQILIKAGATFNNSILSLGQSKKDYMSKGNNTNNSSENY